MEDLVHFVIYKVLDKSEVEEDPEFFSNATDIFGDETYFIEDYCCVGTSCPEGLFIHGTASEIDGLGIDYFIEEHFRENIEFRERLDEISSVELSYKAKGVYFTILTEFHFHGEMVSYWDGDEYETECCFVRIIE